MDFRDFAGVESELTAKRLLRPAGTGRRRLRAGRPHASGPTPGRRGRTDGGAVATATGLQTRPQTRFTAETEAEFYRRKKSSIAVRHVSGDRLVAIVEILSPGNKGSRHAFRSFVDKACELLEHRIHLLLIDPFPPGPRDPNGVHAAIWAEVQDDSFVLPVDKPLTLAAYECDLITRAYIEPVAVGDVLPDMPLFLEPNGCVPAPLEATYQTAFAVMPRRCATNCNHGNELVPPDPFASRSPSFRPHRRPLQSIPPGPPLPGAEFRPSMRVGIGHDTHRLAKAGRCCWAASASSIRAAWPATATPTWCCTPSPTPCSAPPASATSATPTPTPTRAGKAPTRASSSAKPSARLNRAGWRVVNRGCDHLRPGAEARPGQGGHPRQPGRAARPVRRTPSTSRPRPASASATSAGPRRSAARRWC